MIINAFHGVNMKCNTCGYKLEEKDKHETPDIVCPKCENKI